MLLYASNQKLHKILWYIFDSMVIPLDMINLNALSYWEPGVEGENNADHCWPNWLSNWCYMHAKQNTTLIAMKAGLYCKAVHMCCILRDKNYILLEPAQEKCD